MARGRIGFMDAFSLDIRTMAAMASLASILQAVALAVLWRTVPKAAGPSHWAIGGALLALGMILIAFRKVIPDAFSIIVANTFIVGSHAAYLIGIQKYLNLPPSRKLCGFVVGGLAGLFIVFTYIEPNVVVRIVLISIVLALLSGVCAVQFLRRKQKPFADVEILLIFLFTLHAAFHVIRGTYTAFAEHGLSDFMAASIIHGMAFVDIVIFCFAVGIGFSVATVLTTNKALQSELEARSSLLSIIAHDVRTPFSGLIGFIDLIQANIAQDKPQESERFADLLSREAEHVLRLLEDLVTWGKGQFADAAPTNTSLSLTEMVADVLEHFEKEVTGKRLSIETSYDPQEIVADKGIVAMALRNFLSNAIKFSPDGATVRIETRQPGSILVSDSGAGLDPGLFRNGVLDADRLAGFALKGGDIGSDRAGLGVGLSLCARTCVRHGYGFSLANGDSGGVVAELVVPAV
jgi:signal transduction histidine kinase